MNRDEALVEIASAHTEGRRANLRGANLRGASLKDADLRGASLRDADLQDANLRDADLQVASLRDANLRDADLRGANLRGASLKDADLRGASLRGANLRGASLRDADLRGADLRGADLRGADHWGGFRVDGLRSGQVTAVPTPDGWELSVGCWTGTPGELRALVSQDKRWPEATGVEIARRRPGLLAMLAMLDAHMDYHADKLAAVRERRGTTEGKKK